MAEYIDRDTVINKRRRMSEYDEAGWCVTCQAVSVEDIENTPSADVVEVVHSKWIKRNNERRCPICHFFYMTNGTTVYNLCPMCGAKMDGERRSK